MKWRLLAAFLVMCVAATAATTTTAATTKPASKPAQVVRSWQQVVAMIPREAMPGENGRWDRARGTQAKEALEEKLIGEQLALTITVDMIAASRTLVDATFELVDGIHCSVRMTTTPEEVQEVSRGDKLSVTGVINAVQTSNHLRTQSKAAITLILEDTTARK